HRKSPVVLVKELQTHGTIAEPTLHVPAGDLRQGLPDGPLVYAARYTSPLGPQELRQSLGLLPEELDAEGIATGPPLPTVSEESKAVQPATPGRPAPQSVRISVPLLDRLMTLAGELVLVRNQAMQSAQGADIPRRQAAQRLNSVTTELQEAVMLTRMQ